MYFFDANAVVINVRSEAKNKAGYAYLLKFALFTCLTIFMIFSSVSYYAFRDNTMPIFTMTFPLNGYMIFMRFCACINALCSYPLQIIAAFAIIEKHSYFTSGRQTNIKAKKIVVRSVIMSCITATALIVPNFTDFLNIIGSLSSSIVGFILP
jgi:amino acid permease